MAGVKGRSGGFRPGAGRKKKPTPESGWTPPVAQQVEPASCPGEPQEEAETAPVLAQVEGGSTVPPPKYVSPLTFLEGVYMDDKMPLSDRIRAAAVAAGFVHVKKSDEGKKAERAGKAKEVGGLTQFTPGKKPTLRAA